MKNLEAAEAELNRYLDRAAAGVGEARPGQQTANELEEFWRASELRVLAKQRAENRLAWHDYFSHCAHSARCRAEEFEAKAEALLEESGERECQ